jgi:hypothetical protein
VYRLLGIRAFHYISPLLQYFNLSNLGLSEMELAIPQPNAMTEEEQLQATVLLGKETKVLPNDKCPLYQF